MREANDPFQPPPFGAIVNLEGYVLFRGAFEAFPPFGGLPPEMYLQIAPFDDFELEVTELPNVRTITVAPLDFVPGADPVAMLRHEMQVREPHRLHCARGCADVARVARLAQYNTNIVQRIALRHAVE